MSTEEIIRAWKHNEDDAEKQPEGEQPPKGEKLPIRKVRKVPFNSAGEQELSDEDLEAVEGGMVEINTTTYCRG